MASLTRLEELPEGGNWELLGACPVFIELTGSAGAIWAVGDTPPNNASIVGHRLDYSDGGISINFDGLNVYARARKATARVIVSAIPAP